MYEGPGFLRWASGFLPQNGVVVDSGANIGQMLLYLGQMVPRGRVLAFEPGVAQADWLAECLAMNSRLPVELIRTGLGARRRTAFLNDGGHAFTHGGQSQISETSGTPVQIVSLAEELQARSITKVDLWKLDVEGGEIPALEGAHALLEARAIRAIYAEMHEENGRLIRKYLDAFGYRCHAVSSRGTVRLLDNLPGHGNGLFLHSRSY
jgi:FkbM family methyltransferase